MVQMETRTYRISAQDYEDATQLGLIPATIAREAVLKELSRVRATVALSLDELRKFNREFTAAVRPLRTNGSLIKYVCNCGVHYFDLDEARLHYKEAHFQ